MTLARAAVLIKPKTLEAREFARPAIGPDDGLLRIEACGICGSDYEQYEGAQPPHEDYTPFPVIPGHEPLGVIEGIGANARQRWGVREGDRVAVRSGYGCGRCEACSRWEPWLCRKRSGTYGYTDVNKPPQLWGGYAELMYLSPYTVLKKMDPKIPAGVAVMFNPLAPGPSWAASVPRTAPGDRGVVLGARHRGLLSVIAPAAAGAKQSDSTGAGRCPFGKGRTYSRPLDRAEAAIHAVAGQIPGVNPVLGAIVPGAPRVPLGQVARESGGEPTPAGLYRAPGSSTPLESA